VDHFKGREEQLNSDMAEILKLQEKYGTIKDSRFLPKHKPNSMKGKPLVDRFIPGVGFQVFQMDQVLVDISPSVRYRFSGRISFGLAVFKRVAYSRESESLGKNASFGLRISNTTSLVKNLYSHIEYQWGNFDNGGNLNQHTSYGPPSDRKARANFGFGYSYRIWKNIAGYSLYLYDLGKLKTFPNTNGSLFRFGLEFKLKKRTKDSNSNSKT
jgi:hypothetical protein